MVNKIVIGSGIAVAIAIIVVSLVINTNSPELESEDSPMLIKDDDSQIGYSTTIEKFSTRQSSDKITLSVTVNSIIPYDGKKLPISESADSFGYTWLSFTNSDMFHHSPERFAGFFVTLKPGDDGSSPEKWWKVNQVILLRTEFDTSNWCIFSSIDIQGEISVEENELSVIINLNKGISHIPLHRAAVIEIIDNENCLPQKGVQFLDTKLK